MEEKFLISFPYARGMWVVGVGIDIVGVGDGNDTDTFFGNTFSGDGPTIELANLFLCFLVKL